MLYCSNCRAQLDDSEKFCNNCGTAVSENIAQQPEPQNIHVEQHYESPIADKYASASLVMGILSLVLGGGILGIIFGAIANSKASLYVAATGVLSGKAKAGKLMGTIGLILSILGLVAMVIIFAISLIYFLSGEVYPDYYY